MAGTNATITALDAAMKIIYHKYRDLTYKDRPFLGTLPKKKVSGKSNHYPIKYGNGTTGAARFSTAQTNFAPPKYEAWESSAAQDYALGRIDGKAVRAGIAGGMVEGLADSVQACADAILAHLSDSISIRCFRPASGWRAQILSVDASANTITLVNPSEAACFEVGMVCNAGRPTGGVAAKNVGSPMTTIRADFHASGTATGTITGINRNTGVITFSDIYASTDVVAYDYLCRAGDQPVSTVNQCQSGLLEWCPASAPDATAFFGVDRTADSMLGGTRLDASAYGSIEEAIIDGCSLAGEMGGMPKNVVMGWRKWTAFIKEIGSKTNYERIQLQAINGAGKAIADIGYRAIVVHSNTGDVNVFADRHCPHDYCWAYDPNDFVLESLGDLVGFDTFENGSTWRQVYNEDSFEARGLSYPQLVDIAPGNGCIITLP